MRKTITFMLTLTLVPLMTLAPSSADSKGVPNENAVGYWTEANMRSARPIELQVDPRTGIGALVSREPASLVQLDVSGTDWTEGGLPQAIVGKVFFTSGGSNYVCSGALVDDGDSGDDRAIVLTAGHCVSDKGKFVTNFAIVPDYDGGKRTPIYATNLFARTEFATARQFNTTAIQHDWAFAVVRTGIFTKDRSRRSNEDVDKYGSFTLAPAGFSAADQWSNAFGYPAAAPYNGLTLQYAAGQIKIDTGSVTSQSATWGMPSTLTGGASGGPWLSALSDTTLGKNTAGSVSSLNSYKYTNDPNRMYGPKFNCETQSTFNLAMSKLAGDLGNYIDSATCTG